MLKKLLLTVALVLAIMAIAPTFAFADTNQSQQIVDIVKQNEKVLDAKCVVYQRNCVIALKTEKFVSKAEYDEFKTEIEKTVTEKFNVDKVYVTRNPRIMHAIEKFEMLPENEKQEFIENILDKLTNDKRPPLIQPR